MEATTYNIKGEKAGTVQLPDDLFAVKMNPELVYQVAVTLAANQRQNTAHTKDRGEVSGGGKKPWRQKGTGRARQGSIRAPQWRHGGTVFGPRNDRVYGGKINKKMRRKALAMVLSAKVADNTLVMMDDLTIANPKTKEMTAVLEGVKKNNSGFGSGSLLIALAGYDKNAILAARNIAKVKTIEAEKLNVLDLLNSKYLLMPVAALNNIPRLGAKESKEDEQSAQTAGKAAKTAKTAKK